MWEEATKFKRLWENDDLGNEPLPEGVTFGRGFVTASGKAVTVSEEALKKAQSLWCDDDPAEEELQNEKSPLDDSLTAVEKSESVGEPFEALPKDGSSWNNGDFNDRQPNPNVPFIRGFATVSGKTVNVSEEALKKASRFWNDDDQKDELPVQTRAPLVGFATASGKPVRVSDEALNKAKSLWDDNLLADEVPQKSMLTEGGFVTAGGKPVSVSEEALKKAKSFWNDDDQKDELPVQTRAPLVGFATASGKPVSVSDEALNKAKRLWDDNLLADEVPQKSSAGGGFVTAGGKPVSVSEESLKKARSLWNDDEFGGEETASAASGVGFTPTDGATVSVSEESFRKVDNLWSDNGRVAKRTPPNSIVGVGFATAGGKPVAVSDEALRKARNLWDEDDLNDKQTTTTNGASSFSTAGGKPVSVSDEALKKARNLWNDDILSESNSSTPPVSNSNSCAEERAQLVPDISCMTKKKHGFITPYRIAGQQNIATVDTNLNKNNTPVLQSRHPGLVRSSSSAKGLGMRLDRTVRSAESLKRSRSSLCDIGNSSSCNKTPKMNNTNSPSDVNSLSTYPLTSVSPALSTNSTSFQSPADSSLASIADVSDSQMAEVLESSKALLDDDDFDNPSVGTESKRVDTLPEPETKKAIPIASINVVGSPVSLIRAVIARSYPLVYVCKTTGGKTEFLSQSAYEKLESSREITRQVEMEKLFAQIETERLNANKSKLQIPLWSLRKENLENLSIDELVRIIESGDDFSDVQSLLSTQKLAQVLEAREKRREEHVREIQKEVAIRIKNLVCGFASISAMKKVRLIDLSDLKGNMESAQSGLNQRRHAVLSLWRPSDDWQNGLVEGLAVEIHGAGTSQILHEEIRLNSARGTWIQPLPRGHLQHPTEDEISQFKRICFSFDEILNCNVFHPPFGEFDTVGLIVKIDSATANMGERIYLADQHTKIISIKFWRCIGDEGLAGLLRVGSLIAVTNLQWRESSTKDKIPAGFVQETTRFSINPKEIYMKDHLANLKSQILDINSYVSTCEERIYSILNDLDEEDDIEKTPPLKRNIQPYFQIDPAVRKNLMETEDFV